MHRFIIALLSLAAPLWASTITTISFTASTTYFDSTLAARYGNYFGIANTASTFAGEFDITTHQWTDTSALNISVLDVNGTGCGNCFFDGFVTGSVGNVPANRIGGFTASFGDTGQLLNFFAGPSDIEAGISNTGWFQIVRVSGQVVAEGDVTGLMVTSVDPPDARAPEPSLWIIVFAWLALLAGIVTNSRGDR